MAQTQTLLQLLPHFLKRYPVGQTMTASQISSITGTTVVSPYYLSNLQWEVNRFRVRGAGIWWPANTTGLADDWRPIGDLQVSTGTITIPTRTDTTKGSGDQFIIEFGLHPEWFIENANSALRDGYFQNEDWLSLASSAGFQSSALTTDWVESDADLGPATTLSRITTADSFNVFPGFISSGRMLNAAANAYIRQRFVVTRGEQIAVWWLVRADVGTAELGLYDVTNSAELGTQVTTNEENWQVLKRLESVTSGDSGTETLEVRLRGDGASDDLYMNGLIIYATKRRIVPLTTTWDSEFSTPQLSYVTFNNSTASNVWDAFSLVKYPIPSSEYRWLRSRPAANPYAVEFLRSDWAHDPILIHGRRAHSDVDGPFTRAGTETTSMDRDLFCALWAKRMFNDPRVLMEMRKYEDAPSASDLLSQAKRDADEFSAQDPVELPKRVHVWGGSLSN